MKYTYLYIIMLVSVGILFSCQKEERNQSKEEDVSQVGYIMTRAGAPPANETAYTFVSYGKLNTTDYEFNPNYLYRRKPEGTYAYLTDSKYHGIYQPCEVDPNDFSFVKRDPQCGQALINNDYKTICFYPAIKLEQFDSQYRMLYTRNDERYASDPFDMKVQGYEVFELEEELPIYDLRSKVVFNVVQGGSSDFTLEDMVLRNAAHWGWYHPLTQKLTMSYNPTDQYDIYEKGIYETTTSSTETLTIEPIGGIPADIYKTGNTPGKGTITYTTGLDADNGIFFFPNDYSTDNFSQPGLEFVLKINGGKFNISIPFNIKMEKNTRYRFKITVESEVIQVSYKVIPWEGTYNETEDIGTPAEEILGLWEIEEWNKHTDTENIG